MSFLLNPFRFAVVGGGPPSTNQVSWHSGDESYSDTACTTLQSTDAGSVAAMKDRSGNGNHIIQATGSNQPILKTSQINSLPIVRFDGSNDELANGSFSLSQPFTVYLVYKPVSWGAGSRDVMAFSTTGNGVRWQRSSSQMQLWPGSTAITDSDHSTGSFYLVALKFNGSSSAQQTNNNTEVTGGSGSGSAGFDYLGSGNGQQWSQIDVAERLIYGAAHTFSSGDGLLTRQYLNSKYALGLGI